MVDGATTMDGGWMIKFDHGCNGMDGAMVDRATLDFTASIEQCFLE